MVLQTAAILGTPAEGMVLQASALLEQQVCSNVKGTGTGAPLSAHQSLRSGVNYCATHVGQQGALPLRQDLQNASHPQEA